MDELSTEYFTSNSHLFKAFLDDIALVRRCNKDTWDGLSYKQQASLIDNFYEDTGINRNEDNAGDCYASDDYFNVLKIDSGENVVVDFENDANGWTWVDEHSAPFSWKTKSQQNLRLEELFDENANEVTKNNKNTGGRSHDKWSKSKEEFKKDNNINNNNNNKNNNNNNRNNYNDFNISLSSGTLRDTSNEIEMMFKEFGLKSFTDQPEISSSTNQNLSPITSTNQDFLPLTSTNQDFLPLTSTNQDFFPSLSSKKYSPFSTNPNEDLTALSPDQGWKKAGFEGRSYKEATPDDIMSHQNYDDVTTNYRSDDAADFTNTCLVNKQQTNDFVLDLKHHVAHSNTDFVENDFVNKNKNNNYNNNNIKTNTSKAVDKTNDVFVDKVEQKNYDDDDDYVDDDDDDNDDDNNEVKEGFEIAKEEEKGNVDDDVVIICSQPDSVAITIKKTGFDFLDNW